MSVSITQAFIKQYEADVHIAYQRMGAKLRNTVRTKTAVKGEQVIFQKAGTGVAATKSRHGMVPVMNVEHTNVTCTLEDFYAGDWQDKLDELKTNIDERSVLVNAGAYALGRKTDEMILTAASSATTNVVGDYSTGLTKTLLMAAFEKLNAADVPDDGQRFGIVGPHQWNELLNIEEFASSDFASDAYPWLKGTETRKWLGIVWMMHSGLPLSGAQRDCFLWHKTAIGHAIGAEVQSDITWHGDRAAWFVNNMMSQGACLIDGNGVVKIKCKNDSVIS
jgi:hypothetical protein